MVHLLRGNDDKLPGWQELRASLGIGAAACAHIGDDLFDVPVMRVKRHAHYVTRREGGFGAVRELAELILAAQQPVA